MKRAIFFLAAATLLAACSKSSSSNSSAATVSFLVSPPSGATLPNGSTSAVYSQTFTVLSGGTAPYSFGGVALPPGMQIVQLTANACALTGTPSQGGTGLLQFEVADAAGDKEVEQYALTITGQSINTLSVTPATLTGSFVAGQPYTTTFSTTGVAPITWSVTGTLPNGLTFQSSQVNSDTLQGVFTRAGTFNFSINTQDSTGQTGSQNYTVTIN